MTKPTLGKPKSTIEILQKYNFAFQKKWGQNFLIDENVLEKICEAADITKEDYVVEIGPGIGTLTQHLSRAAKHVEAIEIDSKLIPILEDTLEEYENVTILNQDILKVDLSALVKENNEGRPIKVVANLPYYITTPIIMGILENHVPVKSITVMVQKEVAMRMQAVPGTKDYGSLSLAVQYYATPEIVKNVPPNCFIPRPKVGSAVIQLTKNDILKGEVKDEAFLFTVIKASFNQRRKTLVNGLSNSPHVNCGKEEIIKALDQMGKDLAVRGETFTLEDFIKLSNLLDNSKL